MRYQYLLFDLDGTITDPKVGITTCVQYALEHFGIHEPDNDKLEPFIGPPLQDSFEQFYHMDAETAKQAVAKYRERFQTVGLYENEIYDGMADLLKTLKEGGCRLAVASSKPTVFVKKFWSILMWYSILMWWSEVNWMEAVPKRRGSAGSTAAAGPQRSNIFRSDGDDWGPVF